jgi:hypothetical protein
VHGHLTAYFRRRSGRIEQQKYGKKYINSVLRVLFSAASTAPFCTRPLPVVFAGQSNCSLYCWLHIAPGTLESSLTLCHYGRDIRLKKCQSICANQAAGRRNHGDMEFKFMPFRLTLTPRRMRHPTSRPLPSQFDEFVMLKWFLSMMSVMLREITGCVFNGRGMANLQDILPSWRPCFHLRITRKQLMVSLM